MQLLFALTRDEQLTSRDLKNRYREGVSSSYELLLFTLSAFVSITKVSQDDEKNRKSKHLPTEEDKSFSDKLYSNEVIQALCNNKVLTKTAEKKNFDQLITSDFSKKVYSDFAKSDSYKKYVAEDCDLNQTREVLLELFRLCRKDDFFNETMEDHYPSWVDDKSLVVGSIKKVIKAFPDAPADYFKGLVPDAETVDEFGMSLLTDCLEKDAELSAIIEPVINNWDTDRIAIVDMILMKMAVTEMLDFPTIPTKVTLNEYVEVAKMYSTAKSKDFINGVLDKIMKNLEESGKIKKTGRGTLD
jgi:N utilization substance protein B